jgi:ABC-type sugar transport system substrate-binding protein
VLRKISFVLVTLVLFLGMSTATFAQKTTVVRVVVVKTDNPAAYAQALEAGKEVMKKAGVTANTRVYQASYAGPDAGAVVATIEYPSMAALAEAEMKLRADKDYLAWVKGLDKIRIIVSDSIYREL